MNKEGRRSLVGCAVLGILYVAIILITAKPNLHDESEAYFNYGLNLVRTGVYGIVPAIPDDLREPGYGFFLSVILRPLVYFIQEQSALLYWIVFVQAAAFAIAVFLFFQISTLPDALKKIVVLAFFLSPTFAGAHSLIYSESIVITLMVLILALLTGRGFPSPLSAGLLGACGGYILLTKMYFIFLIPIGCLAAIAGFFFGPKFGWKRAHSLGLFAVAAIVAAPFFAWSIRSKDLEKRHRNNDRVIIQLAGKVYRHRDWDLSKEWKAALTASCCISTCARKYGAEVCDKFTWVKSDPLGYSVLQSWLDRPSSEKNKSVLRETLEYWWSTLPIQIVSSGLELIRIAFIEGPRVDADSAAFWKRFARLWHFFGSIAVWILALRGVWVAYIEGRSNSSLRRASLLGFVLVGYHLLFMSQVTNVQRYSQSILPWIYWFSALSVWRIFLFLKSRSSIKQPRRKAQSI